VITVQGSARQGCIVAPVLLFNNDDSNTWWDDKWTKKWKTYGTGRGQMWDSPLFSHFQEETQSNNGRLTYRGQCVGRDYKPDPLEHKSDLTPLATKSPKYFALGVAFLTSALRLPTDQMSLSEHNL
jgi:hypothetical protein